MTFTISAITINIVPSKKPTNKNTVSYILTEANGNKYTVTRRLGIIFGSQITETLRLTLQQEENFAHGYERKNPILLKGRRCPLLSVKPWNPNPIETKLQSISNKIDKLQIEMTALRYELEPTTYLSAVAFQK